MNQDNRIEEFHKAVSFKEIKCLILINEEFKLKTYKQVYSWKYWAEQF